MLKIKKAHEWYQRFQSMFDQQETLQLCDDASPAKVSWEVVDVMTKLKVVAKHVSEYAISAEAELNRLTQPGGVVASRGQVFVDGTTNTLINVAEISRINSRFRDGTLLYGNINLARALQISNAKIRRMCLERIKALRPGVYDKYPNLIRDVPSVIQFDVFNRIFYLHFGFASMVSAEPQISYRFSLTSATSISDTHSMMPYQEFRQQHSSTGGSGMITIASGYEIAQAFQASPDNLNRVHSTHSVPAARGGGKSVGKIMVK
jgi:hypothetical protein